MKINCKAVKISIWISSSSLILTICFALINAKYDNIFMELVKDIILGIFCSSVVTVFFYISAYKVARKKVLEQYWNETRKLMIELGKIEYMQTDYEEEIMVSFVNEQKNKLWMKEYYKLMSQEIPEEEFEKTNYIKNRIKEENKELFEKLSKDGTEKYLDERIDKLYNEISDNINKIVDQYLEYLNYSTDKLNFILGDIEFFTGDKNYKETHKIFEKIYNLRVKIQESARHFRYYKNGEENKTVVLSEILELQKNLFKVEIIDDAKIVYSEFTDRMEIELEEFRAKIIYNIETEKIEIVPLMEILNIKKR